MYNTIVKYYFLLSVIIIQIFSCSGPKQIIQKEYSQTTPPGWINRIPQSDRYIYFVGVSNQAGSLQKGKELAYASGTSQAAKYIGITIKSEFQLHETTERESALVEEKTETKTAGHIAGLIIADEYYIKTTRQAGRLYEEHFDVFLLCSYPKKSGKFERLRQLRIVQEKCSLALSQYNKSQNDLAGGKYADSLFKLNQANKLLQEISDVAKLHDNAYATVFKLKNKIRSSLHLLDNQSRSIFISVIISGEKEHKDKEGFLSALSNIVSEQNLNIVKEPEKARFIISLDIGLRFGGKVFGKQAAYANYNFRITDIWKNNSLAGDTNEVKGFGSGNTAAITQAIMETAIMIGENIIPKLSGYLRPKL